MVQYLQRKPSFGEQMARGGGNAIGEALIGGLEGYTAGKENRALKENYGIDLKGITDPEIRKIAIAQALKGRSEQDKKQIIAAEQGLETVKRQKERLATGHLGPKINWKPLQKGSKGQSKLFSSMTSEGQKVRAGYGQAGKELIQLASTLPIRNKEEFKVLGHKLYDPTLQEAEIEGILDEMEKHIQDAYDSLVPKRRKMQESKKKNVQELDLNQFYNSK